MRIQVHRRGDRRVTKPLLGDLWVHAIGEQLGGVRVPNVVEAHPRQVLDAVPQERELLRNAAWLQRFTVGSAANKSLSGLSDAEREQFCGLFPLEVAKRFNRESRERNGAISAALRLLEAQPGLGLLQALDYAQNSTIKVNILPT